MESKIHKMKMISFCNKKGGVGKTTLCKNVTINIKQDFIAKQFENDVLEHQQLKDNEIELYNNYIRNKYLINIIIPSNFLFVYLVFDNQIIWFKLI